MIQPIPRTEHDPALGAVLVEIAENFLVLLGEDENPLPVGCGDRRAFAAF